MTAPAFIPADESPRFVRFFSWWARDKMLAKKFFAVRLAHGSRPHLEALADHAGPVIAVTNHISWWDPLVMLTLHRLFWPARSLRAPMDAAQLERFAFFRKLGTFGINPDDPASLDAMAAYLRDYFTPAPRPSLWINPQGRFADPREPVEARPGAARVAASDDRTRCVAVAMEYAFWVDQRPEILVRVEPVTPERTNTPGWLRAITDAMHRNAAQLAALVIARDPAGFEALVGGADARINPFYDLWLKLRGKAGGIDDRRDRLRNRPSPRSTPRPRGGRPMNAMLVLAAVAAGLCLLPLVMTLVNLRVYRRSDPAAPWPPVPPRVFACIPARNEAANIEACVRGLLAEGEPNVRVLVYDDQSTDATPDILRRLAADDPRVRPVPTLPLPEGWNGKQHACWRMARAAIDGTLGEAPASDADLLLFTDADVRFEPGALRRAAAEMRRLDAPMLSTFPRQITGTLAEALVVPMMFYLLLGYLPMPRMRATRDPGTSAGCGQFLLITTSAYTAAGGHAAFKDSMHDGIKLPRAVRRAGLRSDLFDGTDLCSVRMYRGWRQTWRGFAKNAYEGLGSPGLLAFITALHIFGHLMPWAVLPLALMSDPARPVTAALCAVAIAMQLAQRVVLASRLRHSMPGALLHPLGVALMTAIQWHSFVLHLTGRRAWRGRVATPSRA